MNILSIYEPGKLVLEDATRPELTDGNAIIEMKMNGICGSDITAYTGNNPTMKYPIRGMGHEGVGVIAEIGPNAKGLKVGDRVALEPYVPCYKCHMCEAGRYNNCKNLQVCGVHKDGMMKDFVSHPVSLIYKIPDSLNFTCAALIEPLSIGLHGATRAKVKKGDYVIIFGAGTIGLMASIACMSYGAIPILVDIVKERLNFAKEKLEIPHAFNSKKDGDLIGYLEKVTNGKLPDAMINCTGSAGIIAEMHNYVCHGGRIALVGWPHDTVQINQIRLMQKEIDIYPSRNSVAKFPEAMNLIDEGKFPIAQLITKVINLDEIEDTIKDISANPGDYLKVIVRT